MCDHSTNLVRLPGLEPGLLSEGDFESPASAYSSQKRMVREDGVEPSQRLYKNRVLPLDDSRTKISLRVPKPCPTRTKVFANHTLTLVHSLPITLRNLECPVGLEPTFTGVETRCLRGARFGGGSLFHSATGTLEYVGGVEPPSEV